MITVEIESVTTKNASHSAVEMMVPNLKPNLIDLFESMALFKDDEWWELNLEKVSLLFVEYLPHLSRR